MNQKNDDKLQRFYSQFDQNHDQLRDDLFTRLEVPQSDSARLQPQLLIRKYIMRSAIGLAACVCLGAFFWASFTPSMTFADVQVAFNEQTWVHVTFDNGQERWASLRDHKQGMKMPDGYVTFIDYDANVRLDYWPDSGFLQKMDAFWSPPDVELTETQRQKRLDRLPKTPLEFVGIYAENMPEGNATQEQKQQKMYMERHTETIDGQAFVRFDSYYKDVLDRQLLMQQIWVDSQTHLPVRIRSRLQLGQRKNLDDAYTVGHYDYPATGPMDIYAMGVPRDLPISQPAKPAPANVDEVIQAATKANRAFPSRLPVSLSRDHLAR